MKNYSLVIDVSEHQGAVDWAILKQGVAAVIIRINSNDGTTIHKDLKFDQFWTGAKAAGLIVSPYIYYDPELGNGQAHYDWLVANMPAGCKTIFADIEQVQAGLDPILYGVEVNKFLKLCQTRWKTIIYTGAWFLPNMTNWSTTLDYWWSAYPASMYPQTPLKQSWSELDTKIQGLSWPAWNWKACPGAIKLWQCSGDRLIIPGSSGTMDINVFPGTIAEYTAWLEYSTIIPENNMVNTLKVPFISQISTGALEHNNDCGAASALMILKAYGSGSETVDQLYNQISPAGDSALSIGGLQQVLAKNGIKNEWKGDMKLADLFSILVADRPVIALIHYAPLVDAKLTEKTGFRGAHFVVVISMDIDYVYIHDPYSLFKGNCLPVPIPIFLQCWAQCVIDGNPINTCIVPTLPIGTTTPPVAGTKYVFGINPANGVPVLAVNVRSGPAQTYSLVKVLEKSTNPTIYITTISGEYGQLADKSGWVFMGYFKPA
jgi:GH25 family lysozyme M1 (1,4-beta-N-acetylmuramidase)